MSLDMLRAVISGYTDHIFDLEIVAVYQGYWSGYYNRAKKPKPTKSIIEKMFRTKERNSKTSKQQKAEEVDVETFLAREQKRLSQMKI